MGADEATWAASSASPCAAPTGSSAVLVFGMSRSGTSLATSLVAAMLGGGDASWRGPNGAAYPTDGRNRLGYFERRDVVALNYEVLRGLSGSWTRFPMGFASRPVALNFSAANGQKRVTFERNARAIVADMASRGAPFVLKDVRLARTLPLWEPLLRARSLNLACILPFRHPFEVERSSISGGDR